MPAASAAVAAEAVAATGSCFCCKLLSEYKGWCFVAIWVHDFGAGPAVARCSCSCTGWLIITSWTDAVPRQCNQLTGFFARRTIKYVDPVCIWDSKGVKPGIWAGKHRAPFQALSHIAKTRHPAQHYQFCTHATPKHAWVAHS